MPATKLKQYLDDNRVRYITIQHSIAFTTQEVAAKMHIHGWEIAKTTILKADGQLVMAVLPAPCKVDLDRMRREIGAKSVVIAAEEEFRNHFPECELGAMPPFGNLYGVPVYVDEQLADDPSIVFNAGTHTEAIRMDYKDFERLVKPKVLRFGVLVG